MVNTLLLVLGWALGIASALIVASIQRKHRLTEISSAILAELDELRYRLAWTCFKISARAGKVDREWLAWFRQVTARYSGPLRESKVDEALSNFSALTDTQIQTLVATFQPQGGTLGLKRLLTPAISANLQNVGGFPEEYQRLLFDVIRQTEAINQETDQADYFFKLTFDTSVVDVNRQIVRSNVEASYALIDKLSRWTIESIDRLDKYRGYDFGNSLWLRNV